MKKWIIQFYEKPEHVKAKRLFLLYLCSGLWIDTFGENPFTDNPFTRPIYLIGLCINLVIIVPFLLGILPFLPILFKRYGFLSYGLVVLFFFHFLILPLFQKWWPIYISPTLGILSGIYMYRTIRAYKKEQSL